MEEEPTRWCSSVDSIRQALELDAQLVQRADQIDQLFDATAQPIQFPDNECVAFRIISNALASPGRSARLPLILSSKCSCFQHHHHVPFEAFPDHWHGIGLDAFG